MGKKIHDNKQITEWRKWQKIQSTELKNQNRLHPLLYTLSGLKGLLFKKILLMTLFKSDCNHVEDPEHFFKAALSTNLNNLALNAVPPLEYFKVYTERILPQEIKFQIRISRIRPCFQ